MKPWLPIAALAVAAGLGVQASSGAPLLLADDYSNYTPPPSSAPSEQPGDEGPIGANGKPYVVKDGKVDQHTFNGWRRYTESCMRCHGPDGAGSSYAPDLTQSLKTLTEEQFKDTVINGRTNVSTSADNVMPSFGEVPDVVLYLDDIYGYLKARSDGALGRGRPRRINES